MATAIRTYVEMKHPAALRPVRIDTSSVRIEHVELCTPAFWRFLYSEVGRRYHWVDKLGLSDDEIRTHLGSGAVSVWLLTSRGTPAGFFELTRDADGGIEISYLGLFDEFVGQGLGAHLVTAAVEQAWTMTSARVWLHTCSLDHAAALPNYLKRGFTVVRTEEYSL